MCLFLISVPPAHAQTTAPDDIEQLYREGIRWYKQGEYQKARVKFVQVKVRDEAYKATETFLTRIDGHLAYETERKAQKEKEETLRAQRKREAAEMRAGKIDRKLRAQQKQAQRQDRLQERRSRAEAKRRREKVARAKKILAEQQRREAKEAARQKRIEERRLAHEQKKMLKERRRQEALQRKEALRLERQKEKLARQETRRKRQEEKTARALEEKKKRAALKEAQQEEHLVRSRERYKQQQAVRQTKDMYREVLASSKAKRFDYARERMAELKTLLRSELLPEAFQREMSLKAEKAAERLAMIEAKVLRAEEQRRERRRDIRKAFRKKSAKPRRTEPQTPATPSRRRAKKVPAQVVPEVSGDVSREETAARSRPGKTSSPRTGEDEDQARLQEKLLSRVDALYCDGVELYRAGTLDMAKTILAEVDKLWPQYKLTRHYLELIDSQVNQRRLLEEISEEKRVVEREKAQVVSEALDAMERKGSRRK